MARKNLLILIAALLIILIAVSGGAGALVYQSVALQPTATSAARPTRPSIADERLTPVFVPTIAPTVPARTSAPTVLVPTRTPLASAPTDTANALAQTFIPTRDLYQIVPRLKKNVVSPFAAPTRVARVRRVGEREQFFVSEDMATGKYRTMNATLQAISTRAYFWIEDGASFDAGALQRSAATFDSKIYPNNEAYFGALNPGLDGDARLHILLARFKDAAGYFSSVDQHPRALMQYSNERNILYIEASQSPLGTTTFDSVVAHEFQHLIHNHQARNKSGWIDEGLGELAIKVNGLPTDGKIDLFSTNPNVQLNTWSTGRESLRHYAASYLFFAFIADRYGRDAIRDVILAPREGIYAVQTMLDKRASGIRFDDFFAEWAVANYLNLPSFENKRYAYTTEPGFRIQREPILNTYPDVRTHKTSQYAANYFTLQPAQNDVTIYFTGTTTAKLLPLDAHDGRWMWYSNRADMANPTLTREIDLTGATRATLQFWTWFDIEKDYDYAYVEASANGGKTWDILPGKFTTNYNPNGASYGFAYTGKSGSADDSAPAQWVQEQMSLTAYAGKKILLRFEYITDDAYNTPGWAVDEIGIPEIGFNDNIERGASGWDAKGFVRTDNVLPQKYIVQVIEQGKTTRVQRVTLNAQNLGSYTVTSFGKDVSFATIVITAHAPTTTEEIEFQFGVAPK
jgi:hypothetical protein